MRAESEATALIGVLKHTGHGGIKFATAAMACHHIWGRLWKLSWRSLKTQCSHTEGEKEPRNQHTSEKPLLRGEKRGTAKCVLWSQRYTVYEYTSYIPMISVMQAKACAQGPQRQRWSQNWHNLSLINIIWHKICKGLLKKTMIKYRDFIVGFL